MKSFKENHFFHFILVIILVVVVFMLLSFFQYGIAVQNRDTNRLASARLIMLALENYKENFHSYPSELKDIYDFLQPIPTDPKTNTLFFYEKIDDGYKIIIPQEKSEDIEFQK